MFLVKYVGVVDGVICRLEIIEFSLDIEVSIIIVLYLIYRYFIIGSNFYEVVEW